MSESLKIALTALFAIAVFVIGQIIQRLFIEPIQDQRKIVGKIAHALTFYANVGPAPAGMTDDQFITPATTTEAMKAVRGLAAELRATLSTIPLYSLMATLRCAVRSNDLIMASRELVGLSNSFSHRDRGPVDRFQKIADYLKLKHQ